MAQEPLLLVYLVLEQPLTSQLTTRSWAMPEPTDAIMRCMLSLREAR